MANIEEIYDTLHGLTHNLGNKTLSIYYDALSNEERNGYVGKKLADFIDALFKASNALDEMKRGEKRWKGERLN